ncbi:hypothetical protein HM1_3151 [Heliomicrobium modesticaldum Ice1]|uniref:Uncharacterized protein n=1 Tax=Heliobacterium modesticaldum (strain ATCC 51547 / Ice1) TaxID=498761 RepID=B0TIG8_HELMI|nr:hypothetical protein HM1_3151 [Heliomicrobium modesticaldum Ice1]
MAERSHPFPSRTRQLSSPAPMVLGTVVPGRVGRCRISRETGRPDSLRSDARTEAGHQGPIAQLARAYD